MAELTASAVTGDTAAVTAVIAESQRALMPPERTVAAAKAAATSRP
jgi:hypothetical protein